jgi:hypothetical protein
LLNWGWRENIEKENDVNDRINITLGDEQIAVLHLFHCGAAYFISYISVCNPRFTARIYGLSYGNISVSNRFQLKSMLVHQRRNNQQKLFNHDFIVCTIDFSRRESTQMRLLLGLSMLIGKKKNKILLYCPFLFFFNLK